MQRIVFAVLFGFAVVLISGNDASASKRAQACAAEVEKARDMPVLATSRGQNEKVDSFLSRAKDAAANGKGKKCEKLLKKAMRLIEGG